MSAVAVALGLLRHEGRWFLQRRDPGASVLPGHWEFPGGKVEPGEAPRESVCRELHEELGWEAERLEALVPLEHTYGDLTVALHPFRCQGRGLPRSPLAWGWFTLEETTRLRVPEATGRLLRSMAGKEGA